MTQDPETRPVSNDSDDALAAAAARGSDDALAQLFQRHGSAVHTMAYRITGSSHDAEDVLQDVFVGLPRALRRYQPHGRFAAWITKVAARVALMRVRARRGGEDLFAEALQLVQPAGVDPIDRITVRDALAALPDAQRIIFLLKEVSGYTHDEIAELLGISIAASRVRLHRAWRALEARVRDT